MENKLLAFLPASERESLALREANLESRHILFDVGDETPLVYFPRDLIISIVVTLASGDTVEAAMVGNDGVVGAMAALDGRISFSRAVVQLSGSSYVCDALTLKKAARQSERLHSLLIRHEQAVYAQAQQSTACMASHNVEARLARWMLRARDLAGTDTLNFTQEFLSNMVVVGRPRVSLVAHSLQEAGIIKYKRGVIQIVDVAALHDVACECYETIRTNYESLLGPLYNDRG